MVFVEAARLSYQLRQLWPQASALTPKSPAQSDVSRAFREREWHKPDAQLHRLPIQVSDVLLVQCPKEPIKYEAQNPKRGCISLSG